MAHDASQNNPLKESVMAVAGLVLLLVIIGGIAVSAWLRPAGEHQPTEAVAAEQTEKSAEAAPADATQEAKSDEQAADKPAEQTTEAEAKTEAEAPKADAQPADAAPIEAPADAQKSAN